jgi:hypothetical protein
LLLLPFSVLAPSLNVRGSKPFERNHKTHSFFLSLRWERRLVGSNPWAWQQEVMDMATLQAPKLFFHVHTHVSLLSLFPPSSPPPAPSLSLFSLSLAEARPSASRHARSRAHTKGSEKILYRADRYGQTGHARDFP